MWLVIQSQGSHFLEVGLPSKSIYCNTIHAAEFDTKHLPITFAPSINIDHYKNNVRTCTSTPPVL